MKEAVKLERAKSGMLLLPDWLVEDMKRYGIDLS